MGEYVKERDWFDEPWEGQDWSKTKLINNEDFMLKQRNRMLYKQLVISKGDLVILKDYLDVSLTGTKPYYVKGLKMMTDLINYKLGVNRIQDEVIVDSQQTCNDLEEAFGLPAFSVMIVRDALATIFGTPYNIRGREDGIKLYANVPTKIKDELELKMVRDYIIDYDHLESGLKLKVANYLQDCIETQGYPLRTQSMLGPSGFRRAKMIQNITSKLETLKHTKDLKELKVYRQVEETVKILEELKISFYVMEKLNIPDKKQYITESRRVEYEVIFHDMIDSLQSTAISREHLMEYYNNYYKFLENK